MQEVYWKSAPQTVPTSSSQYTERGRFLSRLQMRGGIPLSHESEITLFCWLLCLLLEARFSNVNACLLSYQFTRACRLIYGSGKADTFL